MKRLLLCVLALVLAGCAQMTKVGPGETVVDGKLVVKLDGSWNQSALKVVPTATTWTVDGLSVDRLHFFVGLPDGATLAPVAKDARPLVFKAAMPAHEIVSLYQGLLTRDGSSFTLSRLEPVEFLGAPGFRFEYLLVRKGDDVRLQGVAYGVVRDRQLYLMDYAAPRLGFFPRHRPQVELIARGARLKS